MSKKILEIDFIPPFFSYKNAFSVVFYRGKETESVGRKSESVVEKETALDNRSARERI